MAGDWMKIEKHTPDKTEVFAMADELGIDPDAVFGKCFRVWCWFDSHTTNGIANGCGVSKNLIDRMVGVVGFADAMVNAGWLFKEGKGVAAHNFSKHNGKTAKERALTAKRVAKNAAENKKFANETLTEEALPREEKNISISNDIDIKREPKFDPIAYLVLLGSTEEVAKDWVALRKDLKARPTSTAIDQIAKEAGKAGWSLNKALAECCSRGWRGFKADWVSDKAGNAAGRPKTASEKFYEAINKNQIKEVENGRVIDVTPRLG